MQPGRPSALRSLPMLLGSQPGPERCTRGYSLARTASSHAAGKLATLPGSRPRGRAADLGSRVLAGAAQVPSANSQTG